MYLNLLDFTFWGLLVVSLMVGAKLYRRFSQLETLDKFIIASLPLIVLAAGKAFLIKIIALDNWNAIRLAPAFALRHGYQLYYGTNSGPVTGNIYGPLSAIIYLPATLAHSPVTALILAKFLSIIIYFLPVLWLFTKSGFKNNYKAISVFLVWIWFCFSTINSPSLNYSAFKIHADAPALGFGAMACAILYLKKHTESLIYMLLSSTCALLAIFSKQSALPLMVALPAFVFFADGRRLFVRYLLCLLFSSIAVSIIFSGIFNPRFLFFNMSLPFRHPWKVNIGNNQEVIIGIELIRRLGILIQAGVELLRDSYSSVVVLSFYIFYQFLFNNRKTKLSEWLSVNRWAVFAIAGLFMIPTSLAGRAVVGGAVNNFSFTHYFLLVGAGLVLLQVSLGSTSPYANFMQIAIKLLLIILIGLYACIYVFSDNNIDTNVKKFLHNDERVAYEYIRRHPGEAYFPWNPLSSLMAEGKAYHFYFGLLDRELAGFKVRPGHFLADIPANIRIVAYPGKSPKESIDYMKTYLPEFRKRINIEDLPQWIVFTREAKATR
jgi:hypothetical protein